jgi:tetratricopeptide (TPR) repeat protein
VSSFSQFRTKNRVEVLGDLFNWNAQHGRWKEAEAIAVRGERTAPSKGEWIARQRMTLVKQGKTAQAAEAYKLLCKLGSGHPEHSGGWYIQIAWALLSAGDFESAKKHADKACEIVSNMPNSKDGSFGVSESFGVRAQVELELSQFKEAEADARRALQGSVGVASGESLGNLKSLELALRGQHKDADAEKVRAQRRRREPITDALY